MSGFVGGRPVPPAVELLGFTLISADPDLGVAEVDFTGRPEFLNLMGYVQGGYLAAMLDAVSSTAVLAQLPADQLAPTIEMKTSFLRPAPAGRIVGHGRVVHRGRSIAFLEGSLSDPDGALLATSTATVRIVVRR
ncbi:MAG: PaaI family thioesterase [Jatrophihabitantaceae bacterium]